jgi:hypothetical protein
VSAEYPGTEGQFESLEGEAAILESAMILQWISKIGWLGIPNANWIAATLLVISLAIPMGKVLPGALFACALGFMIWGIRVDARERAKKKK